MDFCVAVIGAGVAGLSCAQTLRAAGAVVTVFEMSGAVGGRVASRKTELGGFDLGAQYFTVRDPDFADQVRQWQDAGAVAIWNPHLTLLGDLGPATERGPVASENPVRYVGVPSMATVASQLVAGLDLRLDQKIRSIERLGSGESPRWALKRAADPTGASAIEITEGLYDAVALAMPAPQALTFLEAVPELFALVRPVVVDPCWVLLLGYAQRLPLEYDAAFVRGHRLGWLARDSAKPGRRSGERWVAHAHSAWSKEHFEDDPEDIRIKLLKAFADATGTTVQPVYCAVHRWDHSLPSTPLSSGFLWSAAAGIGACGDWCHGARLEGAWISGRQLARQILATGDEGA